jgi:diguanylate cyclase (GGDEF)-like protein
MYDPLIVDKFIDVLSELAPDPAIETVHRAGLTEIAGATHDALAVLTKPSPQFEAIATSGDEGSTIHTLATALSAAKSVTETGDIVTKHLLRLIPFSVMVLYIYDPNTDEIEAGYVGGEMQLPIRNMRINLGTRLSGWVAANRQTVANSDPVLDLGEIARRSTPKLRSCLSTPITANGTFVGVLTLYSSEADQFGDEHRRIIEAVAEHSALTIRRSMTSAESNDPVTGLPFLAAAFDDEARSEHRTPVRNDSRAIWIDIVGLKHINERFGRAAGNAMLLHVARSLRSELSIGDLLFRYKSDEFIAILRSPASADVSSFSARIKARLETPSTLQELPVAGLEVIVREINTTSEFGELKDLLNRLGDAKSATHRFHVH